MRSSFESGKCDKVTSRLLEFVMSKRIRFSGGVKARLWKYRPDVADSRCCSAAADMNKGKNPSESVSK